MLYNWRPAFYRPTTCGRKHMLCAAAYSSAINALLCSNKRIKYWVSLYGIKLRSKFFVTKWFTSDDCRLQKCMQILHHYCYRPYHDVDSNLKGMEYWLVMCVSCFISKLDMYFVVIHAIEYYCNILYFHEAIIIQFVDYFYSSSIKIYCI